MDSLHVGEAFARLLLASVSGAFLGWEREAHAKPAGLRTHMMVALGAALFVLAGIEFIHSLPDPNQQSVEFGPLRIIQGIIGGVGFLGAGAIIQSRGAVQGITTAASIWFTSAIGICAGLGFYRLNLLAVLFGIFVLQFVGRVESQYFDNDQFDNDDPPEGNLSNP